MGILQDHTQVVCHDHVECTFPLSLICVHIRKVSTTAQHCQPLHATQNGVSDTDWPALVIAQHKHSHRISLISSGRYKVPQERRDCPPIRLLDLARAEHLLGE